MSEFESFCVHNDIDYSITYDMLDFYPRGFVFKKPNGKYHITLNGKHSIEQLQQTFIHEVTHIMKDHLEMNVSFKDIVEEEAELIVKQLNMAISFY